MVTRQVDAVANGDMGGERLLNGFFESMEHWKLEYTLCRLWHPVAMPAVVEQTIVFCRLLLRRNRQNCYSSRATKIPGVSSTRFFRDCAQKK